MLSGQHILRRWDRPPPPERSGLPKRAFSWMCLFAARAGGDTERRAPPQRIETTFWVYNRFLDRAAGSFRATTRTKYHLLDHSLGNSRVNEALDNSRGFADLHSFVAVSAAMSVTVGPVGPACREGLLWFNPEPAATVTLRRRRWLRVKRWGEAHLSLPAEGTYLIRISAG